MALRSEESISEEMLYKKGQEREFFKAALLIIKTFSEDQIRDEIFKTNDAIKTFESKLPTLDAAQSTRIKMELKRLNSKFKMYNYLLV